MADHGKTAGMPDDSQFGDTVYSGGDAVDDSDGLDPIDGLSGGDPDEAQQTGYSPPDRETHNLRERLTPYEESQGESLDERLSEEEPDIATEGRWYTEGQPRAGRLVAPDEGAHGDEESDEVATDVGPAGYASSAEEAAVHVVDEDDL